MPLTKRSGVACFNNSCGGPVGKLCLATFCVVTGRGGCGAPRPRNPVWGARFQKLRPSPATARERVWLGRLREPGFEPCLPGRASVPRQASVTSSVKRKQRHMRSCLAQSKNAKKKKRKRKKERIKRNCEFPKYSLLFFFREGDENSGLWRKENGC